MEPGIKIGLPRMHKEAGERRDFLPNFVGALIHRGARVTLEQGYGSGLGFREEDYRAAGPGVRFAPVEEIYQQDYVLVVRYPDERAIRSMRPGSCLISMIHYPTRPHRIEMLRSAGLEAISLDSIKDDSGRRLVENLRAVAWNGVETAFQLLRKIFPAPGFDHPDRPPIEVTLMGAGAVGMQVVQAAIRYGDESLRQQLFARGVAGVRLTVVDYDLTGRADLMKAILRRTDLLIDATQRVDPSVVIIPNDWLAELPEHAVILDLSVDPYECAPETRAVKSIEGIPQGNLDQYIFPPDDPIYEMVPQCVCSQNRRHVVSCYSWPGLHPQECMQVYGHQLNPIFRALIDAGGIHGINPDGHFFDRAIARAQLSRLIENQG